MIAAGAMVTVHDPYVDHAPGITLTSTLEETIEDADAVVIFAGHRQYRSLDPGEVRDPHREKASRHCGREKYGRPRCFHRKRVYL